MAEGAAADNAVDASPNGRTWTRLVNMAPDATGAPDGGASRIGVNNFAAMNRSHENVTNSSSISIGGWVYLSAAPGNATNLHFDNNTDNYFNLGFVIRGVSTSRIYINHTLTGITHSSTLSTLAWHCFVLVYDRATTTAALWINGVKQTPTASGTPSTTTLGNFRLVPGPNNKHTSIAVWNKALSDAEVAEFYNGGVNLRYANL
jgi:hypothetical protein